MKTAKTTSDTPPSEAGPSGGLGGLRFNSTGREDTTVEVMKTQRDPGAGKKTMAIIAVVVFGLAALGALSFQRSGLKIGEVFNQDSGHGFSPDSNRQVEP